MGLYTEKIFTTKNQTWTVLYLGACPAIRVSQIAPFIDMMVPEKPTKGEFSLSSISLDNLIFRNEL